MRKAHRAVHPVMWLAVAGVVAVMIIAGLNVRRDFDATNTLPAEAGAFLDAQGGGS